MLQEVKVVSKPWGYEEIWAITEHYVGKFLYIKDGHRLSRQYHKVKEETVCVLQGVLTVESSTGETLHLEAGHVFHVSPTTIHRFGAQNGDVQLVEVSTPEIEDVVRLEDDYKRSS
jgi:mannose-6-phosphate isomerase-like protein (cupin superfamily)